MPLMNATSPAQLLSGENEGVQLQFIEGDEVITLAGLKNQMPNPTFERFQARGRAEGWDMGAPLGSDVWNVYGARLTRIDGNGKHHALNPRYWRQNPEELPVGRYQHGIDYPLITGTPMPNPGHPTELARPLEAPEVDVVDLDAAEGFPAGTYPISYCLILGKDPMNSSRITNAAPFANVTLGQGQKPVCTVPDGVQEGATGILWIMGPKNGSVNGPGYAQKRTDLRKSRPLTVTIPGPFRKNRERISPTSRNETYSPTGTMPKPRRFYPKSFGNMERLRTNLSYQLKTEQGWTNAAPALYVDTGRKRYKQELAWQPPNITRLAKEGYLGYRPLFQATDGKYYTLVGSQADSEGFIPLGKHAHILRIDSNEEKWPYIQKPMEVDIHAADESGIPGPDTPITEPFPAGPLRMPPGRYGFRTTNGNISVVPAQESDPSPATVVVLRDSGLAAGGAASGVTDREARVHRPHRQKLLNARFTDKTEDAFGEIDLNWSSERPSGVNINAGDGVLTVDDTSGLLETTQIRASRAHKINPRAQYRARFRVRMHRLQGGSLRINVGFRDENMAPVESKNIGIVTDRDPDGVDGDGEIVSALIGPNDKTSDIETPDNAAYIIISFVNAALVGGTTEARNMRYLIDQIAFIQGPSTIRKRWALDFGLYADKTIETRRTPREEDPAKPYPNSPYCRVVENPRDGARFRAFTFEASHGFENGQFPSYWTQYANESQTLQIAERFALQGNMGARARILASSPADGPRLFRALDPADTKKAIGGWFRAKMIPRPSTVQGARVTIMRISGRRADGTNVTVSRVDLRRDGVLEMISQNGASVSTTTLAREISPADPFHAELVLSGVGGANGRAQVRLRRNGRLLAYTASSLDLSGVTLTGLNVGLMASSEVTEAILDFDNIQVSPDGRTDTDPVPGNYVEYWAPEGSPYHEDNFLKGMRIPVRESTTYRFSGYAGSENVVRPASILPSVFLDEDGTVLQQNLPLTIFRGDNEWERYDVGLDAPEGARYLEFVGGGVADGFIRVQALQIEPETPDGKPSLFDWRNRLSGFFTVTFDTALPGGNDAVKLLDAVEAWNDLGVAGTNDVDDSGNILTSFSTTVAGEERKADLTGASFYPDLKSLEAARGKRRFVRVRVQLDSTSREATPGVRSVQLDVERPLPILLREDGSEWRSSVMVHNLPVAGFASNIVQKEMMNGDMQTEDISRGATPRRFPSVQLEIPRDSVALGLTRRIHHVIEARGKRYHVTGRIPNPEVDRSQSALNQSDFDGIWRHTVTMENVSVREAHDMERGG